MKWISEYNLFLFDFDGLLVDTERLHYQAYIELCAKHGFQLQWSFSRYSVAAHHHSDELRKQIYAEFPELQAMEPDWKILYEEKKAIFLDLVENGKVPLMQGVEELLIALQNEKIKRCVVTHSAQSLINKIRKLNPILDTIPHWVTREDYKLPKPHPECYQIAIAKYSQPGDRIIGFEDSPRGMHALIETPAEPILICPSESSYIENLLLDHPKVRYYPSFLAI